VKKCRRLPDDERRLQSCSFDDSSVQAPGAATPLQGPVDEAHALGLAQCLSLGGPALASSTAASEEAAVLQP